MDLPFSVVLSALILLFLDVPVLGEAFPDVLVQVPLHCPGMPISVGLVPLPFSDGLLPEVPFPVARDELYLCGTCSDVSVPD